MVVNVILGFIDPSIQLSLSCVIVTAAEGKVDKVLSPDSAIGPIVVTVLFRDNCVIGENWGLLKDLQR